MSYMKTTVPRRAMFAARVGTNASVSAGVGVGFDSGEVGARGGFQIAW